MYESFVRRGEIVRAEIKLLAPSVALNYRMRMTEPAAAHASSLPRRLGLWSAVAVLVGSTIGSGIFRSPAGIADKLPGPLPLLVIWVTGGLFALCGALTLAEVAGAFPQTGGVYVYIREAWGRLAAFLFGWTELVLIRAAALGAISTTFAEYMLRVIGTRSGRRALRQLRPLRRGRGDTPDRDASTTSASSGARSSRTSRRWRRSARCSSSSCSRLRSAFRRPAGHYTPGDPAGKLLARCRSGSRSSRCSGSTTAGRT